MRMRHGGLTVTDEPLRRGRLIKGVGGLCLSGARGASGNSLVLSVQLCCELKLL